MATRTIYFGRFISAPTPDDLLIQTGAVLVSSKDGRGIIEKTDWTVNGPSDALSKFGVEVPVVTAPDNGFFFPGFIGKSPHTCSSLVADSESTGEMLRATAAEGIVQGRAQTWTSSIEIE